jgi:hypothetical protein
MLPWHVEKLRSRRTMDVAQFADVGVAGTQEPKAFLSVAAVP